MTVLDHPNFGRFVKNLRIEEGAYYSGLEEITERMPQVETLVLSLIVYSFVDAAKVCHALKYLTPTKLILYDIGSTINRNRSLDAVVESICRMITHSGHLDVFEWHVWWRRKMFALPRTLYFADALDHVPKLRLVAVSCSRNTGMPEFISTLLSKDRTGTHLRDVERRPVLRRDRRYGILGVQEHFLLFSSCFEIIQVLFPAFQFLQVAIADFYNGMLFMKELVYESASVLVRNVYINSDPRVITDMKRKAQDVVQNALCKMSHITELALPACPGDIRLLAQYLGRSLAKLDLCLETNLDHYIANATTEVDILYPEYFSGLETLEVLWLRCSNELPKVASTGISGCTSNFASSKKVTFKRLRVLVIQDYEDGTVFDLLASWDLSTVKRLSFAGSLIRWSQFEIMRVYNIIGSMLETATIETLGLGHGAVEIELCFKSCRIFLGMRRAFDWKLSLRSLSRHAFSSARNNGMHPKSLIVPFFDSIRAALEAIPEDKRNLKEIQIKSLFKWPYTYPELRRSVWPKCLDPLICAFGISVANYKGAPRRPRLQLPRLNSSLG
ncbi:hypothetical protein ACEPAF_417 [Sanghuangporus sanghuang]